MVSRGDNEDRARFLPLGWRVMIRKSFGRSVPPPPFQRIGQVRGRRGFQRWELAPLPTIFERLR